MATNNLIGYAGSASVACSQASLATTSVRESAVRSNTAAKNFDDLVAITFTIASGSPSTGGAWVNFYVNGSVDGTLWPLVQLSSGAMFTTGTGDGSVGLIAVPNGLRSLGSVVVSTVTSTGERTFRSQPFSVAAAFGDRMPAAYSIMIENSTGVAFSTSTATTAQLVHVNGIYTSSGN